MRHLLFTLIALWSPAALACGGLFCNTAQPVNQAAERILFSHHDGQIDMHVRITYSGPPAEFGWLVPVPRGVEAELSSEALFRALDAAYGPQFQLRTEYEGDCDWGMAGGGADSGVALSADGSVAPEDPAPRVQVLSREAIGPYDRVILDAADVGALREWLDTNGFAIPADVDEKLVPYIERDAVFVAIKLLAGAESGDIVPLNLRFPGDRPAIPILPTAVAADPDMGIIVHVLGDTRAIPLNYLHVQINEAAIDWQDNGSNYGDVVSAAADEAGGHAFATDYAGDLTELFVETMAPYSEALLERLAAAHTFGELIDLLPRATLRDPDFNRVFVSRVEIPEDTDPAEFAACPSCYMERDAPVDGAAIAEQIRVEVQPVRERLAERFEATPYLTRLYTTMSAEEMSIDPMFSFNPDLDRVDNVRIATRIVPCDGGEPDWNASVIRLESGVEFEPAEEPIRREGGLTVRGQALHAAAVIEQLPEAGPGVPMRETPPTPPNTPPGEHRGSGGGCTCEAAGGPGGLPILALAVCLFGLTRRFRGPGARD